MTSNKDLALTLLKVEHILEVIKQKIKENDDTNNNNDNKKENEFKPRPRGIPKMYNSPEEVKAAVTRYGRTYYLKNREKCIEYNKAYNKNKTPEQRQKANEYQK